MKVTTQYKNSQIPPKYLALSSLNEIVIDDSSDDQIDRHKQPDPDKDGIASLRTIHSSLASVGHSTKFTGYTTENPMQIIEIKNQIV